MTAFEEHTETRRQTAAKLIQSLQQQLDVVMVRPDRVAADCAALVTLLSESPPEQDIISLHSLLPHLSRRSGDVVIPLFDMLDHFSTISSDPWPLLEGLLLSQDPALAQRALERISERTQAGRLIVNRTVMRAVAARVEAVEYGCTEEPPILRAAEQLVRLWQEADEQNSNVLRLFLHDEEWSIRHLTGRILDSTGEPVPLSTCAALLGQDSLEVLHPYFTYSRISYLDLLALASSPSLGSIPGYFREAERIMGPALLRDVVSAVGWSRLNLGIHVRPIVRVSLGPAVPMNCDPSEAALLQSCGATCRPDRTWMIVTHGTSRHDQHTEETSDDPATKFRRLNLAHADILADFLAMAPLTAARIPTFLHRMDAIVQNFIDLFSTFSDECGILPQVYEGLKSAILTQVPSHDDERPLSPDVTRLVMMFEDPRSIGEVRTLHGLKRYLHQKGLQLGFKLVLRSRSTNCSVDILLASEDRILGQWNGLRYMDFEPPADGAVGGPVIPYAADIVVDGFARQMLAGHTVLPRVDIFCYGNEVHYYLAFKNHPAFVRINFAPPLQGGMIDLEYFGVSKYELSVHPNVSLDALRTFFQRMEFDIRIENTRVQARYDKEQAHDLATLCEKARLLFHFAPYLLDVDWIIGALALDHDAKRKVAAAWADRFFRWGQLPLTELLTDDRQAIVESIEDTAAGPVQRPWSGRVPYADRFDGPPPPEFFLRLADAFERLGLETSEVLSHTVPHALNVRHFERGVLQQLRESVRRGQIRTTHEGFEKISPDLYRSRHEAQYFAEILFDEDALIRSLQVGAILISLERYLSFTTTGQVQGYDVQASRLYLKGMDLGIFVLRGEKSIINLAFYTRGPALYARRESVADAWVLNSCLDAIELAAMLRTANYPVPEAEEFLRTSGSPIRQIRQTYMDRPRGRPRRPAPGERIIVGLRASPGQAVGEVVLGALERRPDDFDERIMVAPCIRPEDAPRMYRAAGIVSTGGGILSHAGLMAAQFRKPAMIIDGQWEMTAGGRTVLRYQCPEYDLAEENIGPWHVTMRQSLAMRTHTLEDGDLVELDTEEGLLHVLGHDRDALALHESLRQLWKSSGQLASSTSDADILVWRGRRLRARHLIEKTFARLRDPVLAGFAIRQLLLGRHGHITSADRASLILLLLNNTAVADVARSHLVWIAEELRRRTVHQWNKACDLLPRAISPFEVLSLRRDALILRHKLVDCNDCLLRCGVHHAAADPCPPEYLDRLALDQLQRQRQDILGKVTRDMEVAGIHLIRQIEKLDRLLGPSTDAAFAAHVGRTADGERRFISRISNRWVVSGTDGGIELHHAAGWKAANLAEAARLTSSDLVPSWFAVTDHAFHELLRSPLQRLLNEKNDLNRPDATLGGTIDDIQQNAGLDMLQKSARIRSLWEAVALPEQLAAAVTEAYGKLAAQSGAPDPYVALRSSSHEEDAEVAARAGEFDTFLYIKGAADVLAYLKRTWSGLWSERALHNRAAMGIANAGGGGVIVQRIVNSRVAGVLQTINVGENETRELVVNAGLGLGEGIVSGTVAADHVVVARHAGMDDSPLRFTYITADKREKIVFNRKTGTGTTRAELPYHQRLRPALEYVELHELILTALRLEAAYGYPLDIEFAFEGTRLWILQVRPVPVYVSVMNDTLAHYPLCPSE